MLHSLVRKPADLRDADRRRMREIMDGSYQGVDPRQFEADLAEKEGCILLHDDAEEIQGFSTFVFLQESYEGRPICALFSGDTVIRECHWGSNELFRAFGRLLERMLREHAGRECYWFLLTQGIRTYLLLPLGFRSFAPRWDGEASAFETGLLHHLARRRYGEAYDPRRGVIRKHNYCLRGPLAQVPEHRKDNPHVRFFLERNPGYTRGEELACLCRVSADNLRRRTALLAGQPREPRRSA